MEGVTKFPTPFFGVFHVRERNFGSSFLQMPYDYILPMINITPIATYQSMTSPSILLNMADA